MTLAALQSAKVRQRIDAALRDGLVSHWPFPEDAGKRLVIEAGGVGSWTISSKASRVVAEPGPTRRPDATVHADALTLAELLEGEHSGVDLWLKGFLRVRGSIALALKLEVLLKGPRKSTYSRPRRVTAGGIDTFLLEAGESSDRLPAILLHGLSATGASMLPTLPPLAKHRRVIVPDLPGFGESGKPLIDYHAEFFAKWVIQLMDSLGIERAHLIGNSMGGRISIEVGLRYPERVGKLVLYCPAVAFRKLRQLVPLVKVIRPELGALPIKVPRSVVMGVMQQIFSKPDRVPAPWFDAAADEFFRVFSTRRGRIALFSAARQIYLDNPWGDRGFWERLKQLGPSALFVWGDRDVLVPSGFSKHVEEALPEARSVVLQDCGHVPQFELPDVLHPLVTDFLGTD
ncbi:MAG: alpha/beta fold hydrolase [Polyangiaceae bacterium]